MVVWLFAGGGETELAGLVPFLERVVPGSVFQRKMPVEIKKSIKTRLEERRGRGENGPSGQGLTGKGFAQYLEERLRRSFTRHDKDEAFPDIVLILDDLDCRPEETAFILVNDVVKRVSPPTSCVIGFAKPEVEAWLIADWQNTFATHPDFKRHHEAMRYFLVQEGVSFGAPEEFSRWDADKRSCEKKLSACIAQAFLDCPNSQGYFSKASDIPELLGLADPGVISDKCPQFKRFYRELLTHRQPA